MLTVKIIVSNNGQEVGYETTPISDFTQAKEYIINAMSQLAQGASASWRIMSGEQVLERGEVSK